MKPHAAMVFAAGFGTRMRPLTDTRPKPLIEVAGRPLLDHALDLVQEVSASAVVNAHYLADQIVTHCATRSDCTVIHETPQVLDTGGGVRNALATLGHDPIFTLNSDAVWAGLNPLHQLAETWDPFRMDALLMLIPLPRTVGYTRPGSFALSADGRIFKDASGLAYTGAQIIKTDLLQDHAEDVFSMHVLWDAVLSAGTAYGLIYEGRWADVGTPEGISLAEQMLAEADV